MSMNVYLKGEEVRKLDGFTNKKKQGGKPVQEWDEYEIPGVKLFYDKGRWYYMHGEPTDPIPAAMKDIVEEISFYELIPLFAKRESGIYRHKSAVAEVQPAMIAGQHRTHVRIKAQKMEDLRELSHKIKVGSIRPDPDESYEGPQGGKSRTDLEAELERMRQSVNGTLRMWQETSDDLVYLKNELRTYSQKLANSAWPFCTKMTVVDETSRILTFSDHRV